MIDGNKFIEMGHLFKEIHKDRGLTSDNLDFKECLADDDYQCGTIACHGGWGCVIFNTGGDYLHGANAIAEFLGFEDHHEFRNWAHNNSKYWGNEYGALMFDSEGYLAFGFGEGDPVTVNDVGDHHVGVGKRINEAKEEKD